MRLVLFIFIVLLLTGCPPQTQSSENSAPTSSASSPPTEETQPAPVTTDFGTTQAPPANPDTSGEAEVEGNAMTGRIYLLPEGTAALPDFSALEPVGNVYTSVFNISPRSFTRGFPGLTDRFEWFAVDYQGECSFEAGEYTFKLESDDGTRLIIDGKVILENDFIHGPTTVETTLTLPAGRLPVRLSYFQGPREEIALRLWLTPVGKEETLFRCQ
jgi:hypothetical protein